MTGMKWPRELHLIRHGESAYNAMKKKKEKDPEYQIFLELYKSGPLGKKCVALAKEMHAKYNLGVGDAKTPLTQAGKNQAFVTGKALRDKWLTREDNMILPEIIFVSPYLRTKQTLEHLTRGWPEMAGAKIVREELIREQEHGLALLYNDSKIFNVLNPEQYLLHKIQGSYEYCFPQGENVAKVRERVRQWFSTVIREYHGYHVMVVTHHLTILSIMADSERLDENEFLRMDREEKPFNCGVTKYRFNTKTEKNERIEYNKKYW